MPYEIAKVAGTQTDGPKFILELLQFPNGQDSYCPHKWQMLENAINAIALLELNWKGCLLIIYVLIVPIALRELTHLTY